MASVMILPDVNVLINAHREDAVHHQEYEAWFTRQVASNKHFGMSELALSAFVRIVTNPRIYAIPTSIDDALATVQRIRVRPNCVIVSPGEKHWDVFAGLCRRTGARGPLVSDAYFAALAIESDCEWISDDGDYGRFPGLRWRRPLEN